MSKSDLLCALGGFWLSYAVGQLLSPRVPSPWECFFVAAFNAFFIGLYYLINRYEKN